MIRGAGTDGALWTDGELLLRVEPGGGAAAQVVRVARPYALIGRLPGADVRLGDPAVSARHAFLYLDARGIFAVDLVSRTGMRAHGQHAITAWLAPGDVLEIADARIELLEARVDGRPVSPPPCSDDPLGDVDNGHLAHVVLEPRGGGGARPWILGSQIAFLGRSNACAVRVEAASAARAHCALVRTTSAAYVVNLIGRLTWLNRRPIHGTARLRDHDVLTVGSADLVVVVEPQDADPQAPTPAALLPEFPTTLVPPGFLDRIRQPGTFADAADAAEMQNAFLTWLLGLFQAGQGELARRQADFQVAMADALNQVQRENTTLLREHLKQIQSINREIAQLRTEFTRAQKAQARPARHNASEAAAANAPAPAAPRPRPLPGRAAPPAPPRPPVADDMPPPLPISPPLPTDSAVDTNASTTWLLQRIGQLEEQNRSSWRDLLQRFHPTRRDD